MRFVLNLLPKASESDSQPPKAEPEPANLLLRGPQSGGSASSSDSDVDDEDSLMIARHGPPAVVSSSRAGSTTEKELRSQLLKVRKLCLPRVRSAA